MFNKAILQTHTRDNMLILLLIGLVEGRSRPSEGNFLSPSLRLLWCPWGCGVRDSARPARMCRGAGHASWGQHCSLSICYYWTSLRVRRSPSHNTEATTAPLLRALTFTRNSPVRSCNHSIVRLRCGLWVARMEKYYSVSLRCGR